ncbi:11106_t:CDS:2 [Acaulospora morrowiae]|uniref:11106_t:CDS:1 n=1 Tax=Acaulospora morrowiae TaxID=94023 RepID=A0A9N8V5E8_9GLOM|nr:11106_t:CDS:2 [Acaulospora morrowiae]
MLGHRFGPVTTKMFDALVKIQSARGFASDIGPKLFSLLNQNELLEDIHEEKNILRYNTEDGKLGKAAVSNSKYGFSNIKSVLLPIFEVTSEEFDEMIDVLGKELNDNESYLDVNRVYGRKKENI